MKKPYILILATTALAAFAALPTVAQTALPGAPDPTQQPARTYSPPPAAGSTPPPYYEEQRHYRRESIGLTAGWGSPYGWGIDYSYLFNDHLDLNAGLGIGVGGKIGIGTRYFFHPERPVSVYVGANLSRSGRVDNIQLDYNGEQASCSILPSGVFHVRGGGRWQPGRIGILGTLGYGVVFTGDPIVFDNNYYFLPNYSPPSLAMRNLARAIGPGGLEISFSLLIGLGR